MATGKKVRIKLIEATPFIKWLGGKRRVVPKLPLPPGEYAYYMEPFLGAGAMYFYLYNQRRIRPEESVLSDANHALINLWKTVRDFPYDLIALMEEHKAKHSREYFYEQREAHCTGSRVLDRMGITEAANMMYLCGASFNGLYRVNKEGKFNAPFGETASGSLPKIFDSVQILVASGALQGARIYTEDFGTPMFRFMEGDFLYLDPPYQASSNTANFTAYTKGWAGWEDHVRLHKHMLKASSNGAYCLQTNSDTPLIRGLYQDDFKIDTILVPRPVNRDGAKRGPVGELVIRNY